MALYISVSADQRPLFPGWLFVRWHPASVCNITVCTHFYHLYVLPAHGLISLWGTRSVPKSTGGAATVPASWVVGSICRFVFCSQIFLQHLLGTHHYVFAEMPDRTSEVPSWTIFTFMRGRTRTGKLTCLVVWTTSSYLGALEGMCFLVNLILFCAVGLSAPLPLPVAHSIHWPSWGQLRVFITKSVSSLWGRSWSRWVHTNWVVGSSSTFLSCSSTFTCIQVLHSMLDLGTYPF